MSGVVSRRVLAALIMSTAFAAPAFAEGYKVIDRIKLPDGGWDYITSDADRGLVYRTRTDGADVIDVKTGKVSQLKNTGNGHMVVVVEGTTLGVLPLRMPAKTIRIIDTAADKVVADVPGGEGPDGAAYDPFSKHVFVANHNGGTVTEVDPSAARASRRSRSARRASSNFPPPTVPDTSSSISRSRASSA